MPKTRLLKPLLCCIALCFSLQAKLQIITTVAGNGLYTYSGDGGVAINAAIGRPKDVDFDASGNMYITDEHYGVIRKVDGVTGIITTIAGNGIKGYSGDNGLAINAELNYPAASAIDPAGNIYISDAINYRIRKVDAKTRIITTIAGTGVWGFSGDSGLAINAQLSVPGGIVLNAAGTILYIADGTNSRIRKVDLTTGIISTIAGTKTYGYNGDGIPAVTANLYFPNAITLDSSGNIFFTDNGNYRIRRIDASTGIISTICGSGIKGYSGDEGLATNATIDQSDGICLNKNGDIFFSQSVNNVIREIRSKDNIVTTVAGDGYGYYWGDGGYATNAEIAFPEGITMDNRGNYFIADFDNSRVRKVTVDSILLNQIYGYAYYDLNSNNLKDIDEPLFNPGEIVSKKNSDSSLTFTPTGIFRIGVDTGTYFSSYIPFKNYYTAVPQSHSSSFSNYNQIDTVYFALQPITGKQDLNISLYQTRPPRPGFPVHYQIYYRNVGTDTISNGTIQLIKDSRLSFDSASPSYSSISGDTIRWNYNSFKPLDASSISLNLHLSSTANTGDTVHLTATINPFQNDLNVQDNMSALNQIAVGSYDPNNKSESHAGTILKTAVTNGDYLVYTILFQNTGTDTALNIVVQDTLSDKLDWGTFEMIDASNNYQLNIKKNICIWNFDAIGLPDSNSNEPASHGYIVYKIRPNRSLLSGDVITNSAGIYFDYNLPVETDTAKTVVQDIVLPLQLLSFTAQRNNETNLLKWSTADEINTDHFEIQRSNNGKDFSAIGYIQSLSNGKIKNNYQYTDNRPLKAVNYYRLKMVDKDGKYSYSTIKSINNASSFDVTLYPNPVKSNLILGFVSEKNTDMQMQIVNAAGKVVFSKKIQVTAGESKQTINASVFSAGNYFIKLISSEGETALKFIKQ